MKITNRFFFTLFVPVMWVMFLSSCSFTPAAQFPEKQKIFGLASLIELKDGEITVVLNDYFHSDVLDEIDSVSADISLRAKLSTDKKSIHLRQRNLNVPQLSELIVWIKGVPYSLLVRRDVRENHTFHFNPEVKRYKEVFIAGDMNHWTPEPMVLVDGAWQLTLSLNPGRYNYHIIADGREMVDPHNPLLLSNDSGGFYSLIEIGSIDQSKNPRVYTTGYKNHTIDVQLVNDYEEVFVLWENFRLKGENLKWDDSRLQITIPGDALKKERSFIRVFVYGKNSLGNDLLIPLQNGIPVTDPGQLTRYDREATIMYFLMVDRFRNGNPARDNPVVDDQVDPRANFYGGDLDGVLEKIRDGYFEDLGVNAVWFSPITQNPLDAYVEFPEPKRKYTGYHGYWPVTLTTIDHRFGDDQVLENLVKAAHVRNISVLLDFVSNHVHENNQLIIDNPHWATALELPDGQLNIRLWDEHRLTTWFDEFLPSLDFSNPQVIQTMADSAFYWIERFNLDGFRHDATKHIPLPFWREITRKLKEEKMIPENRRLFQIGETFGDRELINTYIGSGMLDGKFDFNLYWDTRSVFAIDSLPFSQLDFSLHQSFYYYGFQNLMGNITGNHDMPRFISYAGGDLDFSEDALQVGWEREVGVGDPTGYKKLSALTAFTLTIPGIPVIYYGDEIGLPGANDPDSRRPMQFENLSADQEQVKAMVKKLTRLRHRNLALVYGDFNTLKITDDTYAFSRSYFENRVLVIFNRSNESRAITIDLPAWYRGVDYEVHFGSFVNAQADRIEVNLPPYSFEIITHHQSP
jgi:cyclomaltodextrinase / maltogenic alpha-amylase / neopullulanase